MSTTPLDPTAPSTTDGEAAVTKPRTRRRATRPAAAATASTTGGAADAAAVTPEPAAPAVAAPTTAPVESAPAAAAPAAEAAPAAADAAASPAAAFEEAAPAAPRRRRATRAKAVPAVAPEVVADPAAAELTEEEAAALAAAEAEAAAAAPAPAGAALSPFTIPAAAAPVAAPAAEPAPALDVIAELAATASSRGPVAEQAPRLAMTAVLFQEPTARPRRKRVQAPTGSPEQIIEATRVEAAAAEPAVVEPVVAEAAETVTAPPARGSRRRGATRQQAPAGPVEAEAAPSADAAADVAETEASDVVADEAPAEATTGTSRSRSRGRGRGRGRGQGAAAESAEATDVVDGDALPEFVAGVEVPAGAESLTDDENLDESAESLEAGDDESAESRRRRRRRGGRGRRGRGGAAGENADGAEGAEAELAEDDEAPAAAPAADDEPSEGSSSRRRRRRRGSRSGSGSDDGESRVASDEVTALRGSTRLEAKRQRRREGRDQGRRRQIITEAEFLARREAVERSMIVREKDGRTQIAVLEDGVLVEHYVSRDAQVSMVGNVYLGRVQNVLPSMEAAFVDVGKGRNAVLYAGEVNWDAAGLDGQPRRIEQALKSGDAIMVQVTKDPIGHKGARLTSQITLAGRYLVLVPGGGATGISRKLPDVERNRLKKILREIVPAGAGVIVRTAAEGASEEELHADVTRLQEQWAAIEKKAKSASAPALLQGEPDLAIRVVRDIFNDDIASLVVAGPNAWSEVSGYVTALAPDLADRVTQWASTKDVFAEHRIDEQLAKGMDRKVWLPSGGSLVIDRTEAMTVIDVNTGKFTGVGGTLEETVTRNNIEAAEEIVRQLRLRDIGGIIVIDFIDMVLESNRDLVLRRLVECLGRDRTKHQVAEVTSLGLVQMTRKRVGQGLVEAFSQTCEHCHGRGFIVHTDPVERVYRPDGTDVEDDEPKKSRRRKKDTTAPAVTVPVLPEAREAVKATLATIAAAAAHAHQADGSEAPAQQADADVAPQATGERDAAVADAFGAGDPAAGESDTPAESGSAGDPEVVIEQVSADLFSAMPDDEAAAEAPADTKGAGDSDVANDEAVTAVDEAAPELTTEVTTD